MQKQIIFLQIRLCNAKIILHTQHFPKEVATGAGEMTWRLRALAAPPEDLGSIFSTQLSGYKHL